LLHNFLFLALGMSISVVPRSRHLKSVPALPRKIGSSITSYPSVASRLHSSACCCFFSATFFIYLVLEEYPSSMIHIFLGQPIVWVGTVASRSFSLLKCPFNLILCDLHNHAVWAKLMFVVRGEVTLLYCVRGDTCAITVYRSLACKSPLLHIPAEEDFFSVSSAKQRCLKE